jgi:hypothetical protein
MVRLRMADCSVTYSFSSSSAELTIPRAHGLDRGLDLVVGGAQDPAGIAGVPRGLVQLAGGLLGRLDVGKCSDTVVPSPRRAKKGPDRGIGAGGRECGGVTRT